MTDLNIRGVPMDLMRQIKARAAFLGKTMKQWILDLIARELVARK